MHSHRLLFLFGFTCVLTLVAIGQQVQDTLSGSSDDVVVTATRTERKFGNVAVPVTVIQKQAITATQLRRLNELLQEQTGIFVTSGSGSGSFGGGIFGNGAQLQGMSPEYTLILINGEPIVGRQGGTLNLSRLTLGNIKRIEIVKGPSSSLYGSEAMGGVINIITEMPATPQVQLNAKAGGYGLADVNAEGTYANDKTRLQLAYNYYRMGAIDFDETQYGNQHDPFNAHTAQLNMSHAFSNRLKLVAYGRYYYEKSDNAYEVPDPNLHPVRISGNTTINDANVNTSLLYSVSKKVKTALRLYATGYHSSQQLIQDSDKSDYYTDDFRQQFYRIENQTDITLPANNTLSAGGGWVYEKLNTTRYEGMRDNSIVYGFVQNEWRPSDKVNLIGGLRYDVNREYASRFSPKLAVRYSPTKKLKLTASYGAGFKAPDFRQLYLSFVNNASGGYAIFGANEISIATLQQMQQQGFVATILPKAYDMQQLKPEVSRGFNLGALYTFCEKLQAEANLFNNDIENQILFDVIALRANGSQVFSYFNVQRSFTRGAEVNVRWYALPGLQVSGGYQLLFTGDKAVVDQIEAGKMYGREESTNDVYKMTRSDYYGLPNRSRHMANLKLLYTHAPTGWQVSVRGAWRNAWGTFDRDGNGVITRDDEKAPGFLLLNAAVSKNFGKRYTLAVGAENILNHRDPENLPNIPGINAFVSFSVLLQKQNHHTK